MKRLKPVLLILVFIVLVFIKNVAFWSDSRTYFFGDTAVYPLHLAALSNNLGSLFSAKDSLFLWNPNYLSLGIPTLSVVDMGILYPPNIVIAILARIFNQEMLVFPLYDLFILFHLFFGALFIYKILKDGLNLNFFSSIIGAFFWIYSGFNLEFITSAPVMMAAAYLPFCFYLSLNQTIPKLDRRFISFFIALGFSFLVGYPMVSLIVYGICLIFRLFNRQELRRKFLKAAAFEILGFMFITLPMIMPLYLTSYFYLGLSVRASLSLEGFLFSPVPPLNIVEPFLPKNTFFNTISSVNQVYLYFSLVALLITLQVKSLKTLIGSKQNRILIFLGLAGLLLCLGKAGDLATLVYFLVPGINIFRRLSVFSLVPTFVFVLLVPQIIEGALENKFFSKATLFWIKVLAVLWIYAQAISLLNYGDLANSANLNYLFQSLLLTTLISGLAILAFYLYRTNKKLGQAVLIFAVLMEGGSLTASKFFLNAKLDPATLFKPNSIIRLLKENLKPMERVDLISTQNGYNTDFLNIEQEGGYLSLASNYGVEINEAFNRDDYSKNNLRDILGIRYVIKKTELNDSGLTKIKILKQNSVKPDLFYFSASTISWEPEPPEVNYNIYVNKNSLPRIYLASGLIGVDHQDKDTLKFLESLKEPTEVVLNTQDLKKASLANGSVRVVEYRRNYIKTVVNSGGPVFLANATAFYPGWSLKINGQDAKPLQTNWFMMGTYLPKGQNTVEFSYFPKTITLSLYYFLLSIVFWLFLIPLRWMTKIKP
ncbi:MAG: YfhO family protein [Patescibacteria group bacterium]|nr:YfhO family protein [Patescibacteria group bacterium]